MQQIEVVLAIASTAVGLLITTITFILKFINSDKAKKFSDWLLKARDEVLGFIEQAESMTHLDGNEKFNVVMEKVKEFAKQHNIPFGPKVEELLMQKVNDYVALTKVVNISEIPKAEAEEKILTETKPNSTTSD
jgi:hypothetical protein